MNAPLWKRALSYLYEIEIERYSSELNPELWVSMKRGRFLLNTPEAVYSYEDKYDNFGKAIHHFGSERFRPKTRESPQDSRSENDILLLGLGMGSIPLIFERKHELKLDFTAVEKDPAVIELFSKYALPQLKSSVTVVQADAAIWTELCEEQFAVIMMDVFVDDTIPEAFQTHRYLQNLNRILRPGGLLLYNVLHSSPADRLAARTFYNDVFLKAFPDGENLDVGGNWILVYEKA